MDFSLIEGDRRRRRGPLVIRLCRADCPQRRKRGTRGEGAMMMTLIEYMTDRLHLMAHGLRRSEQVRGRMA
jgi:hypothetical protein